jgi:tRNA-dihydrouridine synthase B
MEGHTDLAFRTLCRELGANVVFTEFTAWQALRSDRGGGLRKIRLSDHERPAGIQLYGRVPHRMAEAAQVACRLEPELIDLNFGCPAKRTASGACGSHLMREPEVLFEVVTAVLKASDRPVTCKMRLGWDEKSINVVDIARRLEELGVSAVTIHGRTRCQKYLGHADWDWIARVAEAVSIPVVANGDINSAADAELVLRHTGASGVMIGRAALEDPWVFQRVRARLDGCPEPVPPTDEERVAACLRHLELSVFDRGEVWGVRRMRSRYKLYFGHREDFADLRASLVVLDEAAAVRDCLTARAL